MIEELEKEYPVGSDITIMNSYYNYPTFKDGKKVTDDFIVISYRNNITGNVENKIIFNPTYTYYKCKPGINPDYNMLFIEKEKVDEINVPFRDLEKSIAEETDNMSFYKQNIANRDRYNNKKLHTLPNIFFSDTSIEDHYRFKFNLLYSNNIPKVTKGFFDIELDAIDSEGEQSTLGECPINCVSFCNESTSNTFTFILRNPKNPQIQEFENKVSSGVINNTFIKNFVREAVSKSDPEKKYKREAKYGLADMKYEFRFYNEEIDLIKDLFAVIHHYKPNFCLGWNSSAFDIAYIIERIKVLGYDPADIVCDQSWKVKVVKNYVDTRNINDFAERGDYTFISGSTIFIDQMIQYCSRRKAKMGSYASFKLDDIGEIEAQVNKLDYSHITHSVVKLPWLDFETFVLYNIMDVIVQKCIETQTQDIEYLFTKALVNNTSYKKAHRQSIYLVNRFANEWYKIGYIIGNNCNKTNEKGAKFLGALVGNSKLTNDYSKIKIGDQVIWVCDNNIDFDKLNVA